MRNPFLNFYRVLNAQELLDIAFRRAMKSSASVSSNAPIIIKAKKKESKRIKVAIEELIDRILKIIKMVPIIEDLPEFYKELASLMIDTDKLRLTLGKLNGILPVLSKLERDYLGRLRRIEEPKEGDRLRREVFGRVSSIIRKQSENLEYLNSIRGKLRGIPSIDYSIPCVVCAGAPNVGKSSIVKQISTKKNIEVQEYPFTTKKLILGHINIKRRFDTIQIQIMDSPGILDRPISDRNNIEKQAILALRLISDLIIFVFDPTPACGYNLDSQVNLFNEVQEKFIQRENIDIIIVFNKKDLASESEISHLQERLGIGNDDYILTNALTGENLDEIFAQLKKQFAEDYKEL
ncbi:MAG: GTP-binding protein [Candidatus Lokiarchaeota archaeon]|nr:GTP-binding protein [Candidatus Lokiarchaeota archaeon]